jgi:hypothetical protein
VRIFLNRKRGVPIDDGRHGYEVRLPFVDPRYPNDAAVEFALGGKVAVWQSRRPEIMVHAALVIFGTDSTFRRSPARPFAVLPHHRLGVLPLGSPQMNTAQSLAALVLRSTTG